jgi:hypothetical protein
MNTHVNADGEEIKLPSTDADKLHEEPGVTSSGRIRMGSDFTMGLPTGVNERELIELGLHPMWTLFTRRPAHAHMNPTYPVDTSDGRIYMSVGRDDIVEACTDNPDYDLGHAMQEEVRKLKFNKKEFTAFLHENFQLRGISAILELLMKWYHVRWGSQLVVENEVTNDLALTDLAEVKIEEIPFPADSMEFYFADPLLPTVLVYRGNLASMSEKLGIENIFSADTGTRDSLNFWVETKSGAGFSFRANDSNWNSLLYANNDEIPALKGSVAFSDEEWAQVQPLFQMCIKVLVYASIPHHTTEIVGTKGKHFPLGGKPGIRNRPRTDSVRVVYLPEISTERISVEGGGKHEFKGRRGHLRKYKHERFAASGLQGTWQFIAPVRGPNGEIPAAVYKVRKPKPNAPRRGAT